MHVPPRAEPGPSDEGLMLLVRSGEVGLMSDLFERHHRSVYGFLYRMCGNRAQAEDLVQEVFLRILKYRETYQPRTSFTAWMYGIARNAYIDQARKRKAETTWDGEGVDMPSRELPVDERLRARQEAVLIERALMSLPPDKREVLVLSRYQDLRYDEIGRILGCEANTVKQRVFRAVRALGERFAELSAPPVGRGDA